MTLTQTLWDRTWLVYVLFIGIFFTFQERNQSTQILAFFIIALAVVIYTLCRVWYYKYRYIVENEVITSIGELSTTRLSLKNVKDVYWNKYDIFSYNKITIEYNDSKTFNLNMAGLSKEDRLKLFSFLKDNFSPSGKESSAQ